jgi:hypothetical protein
MRTMQGGMFAAVALVALVACGKEKQPEATPAATPAAAPAPPPAPVVASAPTKATLARAAAAPKVPKKSTQATSIGSGALQVSTAQAGDKGDPSWVEQIDVDGDSTAAAVTVLWDDEVNILYMYGQDDEVCSAGGVANLQVLVALFGAGNAKGAPVGSGWKADFVDATQCGAAAPVLYGERFDSTGTITATGVATIDPATGDLVIASSTPAPAAAPADSTAAAPAKP